jgi:hypothetical protein
MNAKDHYGQALLSICVCRLECLACPLSGVAWHTHYGDGVCPQHRGAPVV